MSTPKFKQAGVTEEAIRRFFDGLEVIEAKRELRIQPNAVDSKDAVRDDPTACVFSRACQRVYGSQAVLFFKTIAYVDLLGTRGKSKGKRRIERFTIGHAGRKFIRDFDAGKVTSPAGFVLLPPSQCATLVGVAQSKARLKKKSREAILVGQKRYGSKAKRKPRKASVSRIKGLRNGMGMVHFSPKD